MKTRQMLWRIGFYTFGTISLALGVALCAKAELGLSCVSSVGYSISNAFEMNFALCVFLVNVVSVAIQLCIHRGKNWWKDLLQIPYSAAFSVCLDWFENLMDIHYVHLWQNLLLMVPAIICVGVGVYFIVNMNLVPIAADGMTYAISIQWGRSMGLTKNITDMVCVTISVTIDLVFTGRVSSVGICTVGCMIFVGRVIAVLERFCGRQVMALSGQSKGKKAHAS